MSSKRVEIIWRYGLVSAVISLIAFAIIYNVVQTTIVDRDEWNKKADSLLTRVLYVQPVRGDIQACDGSILATNLTVYDICLDYKTVSRQQKTFENNVKALADSMAKYYPRRNYNEWLYYLSIPMAKDEKNRTQYHVLLRNVTLDDYDRILKFPFFKEFKSKYKHGLYTDTKVRRVYPYGEMAQFSIGRCNYTRVPKFEGAATNNDSIDVLVGYSGLEAALNSHLYGSKGTASYVQLTQGVRKWTDTPPQNGNTLRTTIDINIQDIVERELFGMVRTSKAQWGTCLVMEVATGDIKAISNIEYNAEKDIYEEARNYAVMAFEPGSVMKPISMICALEDGYAHPLNREYQIGGAYAYAGGRPIRDSHSPATLPVGRFIEYSSNIGMTKLIAPRYESNLNGFRERLSQIGFLDTLGTGLHLERPPYVPHLDPKRGGRISLSRMTYGYATMIPPLYTCAMYNAIANNGKFVRPRIIKEEITPDGTVVPNPTSYVRDSICSVRNAQLLQEMLLSVVYGEGGTAKTLRNDLVKIAGKTGTCIIANETRKKSPADTTKTVKKENADKGASGYREGHYRLAFCGFFPYEKPKYTCMVLICDPAEKAYNAPAPSSGRVVKEIALKMYARGMFDTHPDYREMDDHTPSPAVLYASQTDISDNVRQMASTNIKNIKYPTARHDGCVPDVKYLGMRESIARIEEAGYTVNINGSGYAVRQSPAAGTPLAPGSTVNITYSTDLIKTN